ncbi:MAG: hypothetical protein ACD_20C00107G0009 [uncultured bacterium]|nr:MAG: hypothetical protein ACD_20C00107G0009 [uncultured bacterium]
MRRSNLRRKAQGYVEYAAVGAIVLALTIISFPPLFLTASNNVANTSPEDKNNDIYKQSALLGVYAGEFITAFRVLEEDPSASGCVEEIKNAMSVLSGINTTGSSELSKESLVKIVSALGDANLSGSYNTNASSLLTSTCGSIAGADSIESILTNELIKLDLMEATCEDVCTVTTTANTIMRDMATLITSGSVPMDVFLNHPDSPVTAISGSVQDILTQHYYVGPDTEKPYATYKNAINLIEYASDQGYFTPEMAGLYDTLVVKLEDAMKIKLKPPSYYKSISRPGWESKPVYIGPETAYTPPSSDDEDDDSSGPVVADFYFCEE